MKDFAANVFFRFWYWLVCKVDRKSVVTFMNYGFTKNNEEIELEEKDKSNRYSAQLYINATRIDIKDKDILEVGCGRGGGLSYVKRYLSPKSATGVDLNDKAIEFCNSHYAGQNIKFIQGNAQQLKFDDNSFDAIINVESSHRYPQFEKFISESYRVLKPNGYFLFTDFRFQHQLAKLSQQIKDSGFEVVEHEIITPHVLEALILSSNETIKLIQNMAPKFCTE
jgi:ubiquinone/menaquinone biosynthesis C-methylase UbiE